MNQKELKELYMEIMKNEVWPGCERMQGHSRKTLAYIVELSDGSIIAFEKPRIKTRFCYGAGMYGTATGEQEQAAADMARTARTSEEYFKNANLEEINQKIESLQKAKNGPEREVYCYLYYSGQEPGSKLKRYTCCSWVDNPVNKPYRWNHCKDLKKLDIQDIDTIISGLEEVRKAFAKRIDAYLKRYGLSKVDTWTYILD